MVRKVPILRRGFTKTYCTGRTHFKDVPTREGFAYSGPADQHESAVAVRRKDNFSTSQYTEHDLTF